MSKPSKCRKCGWQKFDSKSVCVNPDCDSRPVRAFAKSSLYVMSACSRHNHHEVTLAPRQYYSK